MCCPFIYPLLLDEFMLRDFEMDVKHVKNENFQSTLDALFFFKCLLNEFLGYSLKCEKKITTALGETEHRLIKSCITQCGITFFKVKKK